MRQWMCLHEQQDSDYWTYFELVIIWDYGAYVSCW